VDGARPPFDDPTPAGRALDGARLSFGRFAHGASLLVGVKSRASARRRRLSNAVFSTACGADDRPLTLPVAPRSTWKPRFMRGARTAATTIASTTAAFPAQSVFPRQSVSCRIAFAVSCVFGDPPPIPRLCHRRFGFRRSFATSTLSREEARPDIVIRELFARGRDGPNAACRLLQPMRPASTTTVRPNPARPPFWSPRRAACLLQLPHRSPSHARVATHLSVRSQSRVTGQGPPEASTPLRSAPPLRDRSRGELRPNPIGSDTSCRVLVTFAGWR
jgi:hypothetical protein